MQTVGKDPVISLGLEEYREQWVTVRRDVLGDLRLLYPKIELLNIRGIKFRGFGYIDDIRLYEYKDTDHDLLPDDFEKRNKTNPKNPKDATLSLLEKVLELTSSPDGKENHDKAKTKNREESEKKEKPCQKRRRYRVSLNAEEQEEMERYFKEMFAKRLAQAPRPQKGRLYRVRLRAGGEITGRLEKFTAGRISLKTKHGEFAMPIHLVSRQDTPALFPQEAARQRAIRDVQKKINRIIDVKIKEIEKMAASKARQQAETTVKADDEKPLAAEMAPAAIRPLVQVTEGGKPRYDATPAPSPEDLKPVLQSFSTWLKTQHRRVGGRIGTRMYAKQQNGNAVLYLTMAPTFLEQEYDFRHRMAVGLQQFWAFRCQGMGVADIGSGHLVMLDTEGEIVGGSRPEDPSDIWVNE